MVTWDDFRNHVRNIPGLPGDGKMEFWIGTGAFVSEASANVLGHGAGNHVLVSGAAMAAVGVHRIWQARAKKQPGPDLDDQLRIHQRSGSTRIIGEAHEFVSEQYKRMRYHGHAIAIPPLNSFAAGQAANPNSIVAVSDNTGQVRGVVELWTIKPKALNQLLTGAINESELAADVFLPYERAGSAPAIYAAITAPITERRSGNAHCLRACLAGALDTLEKAYRAQLRRGGVKVYALEASEAGQRLMLKLGFRIDSSIKHGGGDPVWSCVVDADRVRSLRKQFRLQPGRFSWARA